MKRSIQVLVSDLGKVLLPFEVQRVWDALDPHFGISARQARQVVQTLFAETRFGTGGADGETFYRHMVERTGLRLAYPAFCRAWSDMFWEDAAVIRLVSEAPVERRYLLSNTNAIHWAFIQEQYPHVLRPFDCLAASHELGLEKPDPRIYEWVVSHSGYPAAAHLFIDDISANVEAARAAGMDAILHTDAVTLWEEFRCRELATADSRPERADPVEATPAVRALRSPASPPQE